MTLVNSIWIKLVAARIWSLAEALRYNFTHTHTHLAEALRYNFIISMEKQAQWRYVGLARTVYIRIYTPYIRWFPSRKYRMYTVYIWFWPTLKICNVSSVILENVFSTRIMTEGGNWRPNQACFNIIFGSCAATLQALIFILSSILIVIQSITGC
jgi:hypothetical protein